MITIKELGTKPIAIHGNGNSKNESVYNTLKQRQFYRSVDSIKNNFTFISWKGGNIAGRTTILEQSANQYGFKVLNLEWKPTDGFWKGTQQKMTTTLNAINSGQITTEYVFWLDNTDVFFIDSPDAFFEKYKHVYGKYDFVWNAEKNNFPTTSHGKWLNSKKGAPANIDDKLNQVIQYDETFNSNWKYMNSGAGFGKTSSLKQQLEIAISLMGTSRLTDQALMRIAQHEMRDTTIVDRLCELFVCCWGVTDKEVTYA
jgi:hypothetical protein